jgi:hypothetical protein
MTIVLNSLHFVATAFLNFQMPPKRKRAAPAKAPGADDANGDDFDVIPGEVSNCTCRATVGPAHSRGRARKKNNYSKKKKNRFFLFRALTELHRSTKTVRSTLS